MADTSEHAPISPAAQSFVRAMRKAVIINVFKVEVEDPRMKLLIVQWTVGGIGFNVQLSWGVDGNH